MPKNQDNNTLSYRQNYFEKWHIFRGWNHGCKACEECNHHSHIYSKRCKKVAEGIYKLYECLRVQFVSKNLHN